MRKYNFYHFYDYLLPNAHTYNETALINYIRHTIMLKRPIAKGLDEVQNVIENCICHYCHADL